MSSCSQTISLSPNKQEDPIPKSLQPTHQAFSWQQVCEGVSLWEPLIESRHSLIRIPCSPRMNLSRFSKYSEISRSAALNFWSQSCIVMPVIPSMGSPALLRDRLRGFVGRWGREGVGRDGGRGGRRLSPSPVMAMCYPSGRGEGANRKFIKVLPILQERKDTQTIRVYYRNGNVLKKE